MHALYTLVDHSQVLAHGDKRYVLKVRDLPQDEKPREKLLKYGPDALSTAELLAIVFGVGTRKEEVLAMTGRIMKEYGAKSLLMQKNAATLASDLDIPVTKALQIVACAEMGRRFFAKNENGVPTIRTAKDVWQHTVDMHGLSKEHLRGIYLNTHYKVIHDEIISIGTLDANLVHPREVFKPAVEYSAAAVILVHNHPSGITTPSAADLEVTRQLQEAGRLIGIDVIDHVIVTREGYVSISGEEV